MPLRVFPLIFLWTPLVTPASDLRIGWLLNNEEGDGHFNRCMWKAAQTALMSYSLSESIKLVASADWKSLYKSGVRVFLASAPKHPLKIPLDTLFIDPLYALSSTRSEHWDILYLALLEKVVLLEADMVVPYFSDTFSIEEIKNIMRTVETFSHLNNLILEQHLQIHQVLEARKNQNQTIALLLSNPNDVLQVIELLLDATQDISNAKWIILCPHAQRIERGLLLNPVLRTFLQRKHIELYTAEYYGSLHDPTLSARRRRFFTYQVKDSYCPREIFNVFLNAHRAVTASNADRDIQPPISETDEGPIVVARFLDFPPSSTSIVLQRSPWFIDDVYNVEQSSKSESSSERILRAFDVVPKFWLKHILGEFREENILVHLRIYDPWTYQSMLRTYRLDQMPAFLLVPGAAGYYESVEFFNGTSHPKQILQVSCPGWGEESSAAGECQIWSHKEHQSTTAWEGSRWDVFEDVSAIFKGRSKRDVSGLYDDYDTFIRQSSKYDQEMKLTPEELERRKLWRERFRKWLMRKQHQRNIPEMDDIGKDYDKNRLVQKFKRRSWDLYKTVNEYQIKKLFPGSLTVLTALTASTIGVCLGSILGCVDCATVAQNTAGQVLEDGGANAVCMPPCVVFIAAACGASIGGQVQAFYQSRSVICSELHAQGYIDLETLVLDNNFGNTLLPEVIHGYHVLAAPVVSAMQVGPPAVASLVNWLAGPWMHQMKFLAGFEHESSRLGATLTNIGVAVCGSLGTWIQYLGL